MKAKFNGKEYRVSTYINGYGEEWFEIEEIKEVKEQPKQPQRKFKAGDKVKIKYGISSKTHIVAGYTEEGNVFFNEDEMEYVFHEDWLEPWSDEPKVGDWVIAWNNDMSLAVIGVKINATPMQACKHVLNNNNSYKYAVKFNGTRDHLEKIRSGKV